MGPEEHWDLGLGPLITALSVILSTHISPLPRMALFPFGLLHSISLYYNTLLRPKIIHFHVELSRVLLVLKKGTVFLFFFFFLSALFFLLSALEGS